MNELDGLKLNSDDGIISPECPFKLNQLSTAPLFLYLEPSVFFLAAALSREVSGLSGGVRACVRPCVSVAHFVFSSQSICCDIGGSVLVLRLQPVAEAINRSHCGAAESR